MDRAQLGSSPILSVAPMEGLTTHVYRTLHARMFGGADVYYMPFVTPTICPKFTARQLRDIAPENNFGIPVTPQLLSNRSADFIWAVKALADMGYKEVNLNLGCPAGTVVARGRGSGFLRNLVGLKTFLNDIFNENLPLPISIKTRIGWSNEDEFEDLLNLYLSYPLKLLIVHPRLKTDQYRGKARILMLAKYRSQINVPLGINGDLITVGDLQRTRTEFSPQMLMVGRALMADPALFRKYRGGKAATSDEIKNFSEALFEGYCKAFGSRKNAMMRMKEYWFFLANLFEGGPKLSKAIFKSKTEDDMRKAIGNVLALPILGEPTYGWFKPL